MPARFCSECGEPLKVKRASLMPFRAFCRQCVPRFKTARFVLLAAIAACTAIGFAIGHYTGVREPFYFIGTPVDLTGNRVASSADNNSDHSSRGNATLARPEQLVISPSAAADTICGARTKSGKPCRRKVKGGGYCWQHRG